LLNEYKIGDLMKEGWTFRKVKTATMPEGTIFPGFSCDAYFLQKPHECGGFAYTVNDGRVLVCTSCDCRIVYEDHGVKDEMDSW
jgi:hypothetical protein